MYLTGTVPDINIALKRVDEKRKNDVVALYDSRGDYTFDDLIMKVTK